MADTPQMQIKKIAREMYSRIDMQIHAGRSGLVFDL